MSKELDELVANFDELSKKAEHEADDKVGVQLAGVTRMTSQELRELFPTYEEQRRLAELIRIVRSEDDHNKKVNDIMRRVEDFSGIVVKLLGRFV